MGVADLDLCDPAKSSLFERSREEMSGILAKKKIPEAEAKCAIAETLEVAADHQLQGLRQKDSQRDRVRSVGDVGKLIARLEELAEAIAKLPPVSKKKLNSIVADHTEHCFDTETFAAMIQGIADALPTLAPKRLALDVLDVIERPIAGVTSPPELWETMPAETRQQVEQHVRSSEAKTSATEFLGQLVISLRNFLPQAKQGRLPTIQKRYIGRVGMIWTGLGLKIGRAYDGAQGKNVESNFQRFARLALAAVGDNSVVSRRQITNFKKKTLP